MAGQWPISSGALHRRPPFARAQGLAVPPGLEGYAPGTPALPRVNVEAGAGGSEMINVPPAYRWDGTGTAPPEIYQLATAIACLFGYPPNTLPAATDPNVAQFVGATYQKLIDAAGLTHDQIYGAIAQYAADGPVRIAQALHVLVNDAGHGDLIVGCATPNPPAPPAAPPTIVAPTRTPAPTMVLSKPPAPEAPKKVPWGWIVGGVGLLAAIGIGWYFATRKPKRKNAGSVLEVRGNPCAACAHGNPSSVIETEGYEVEENPYSGTRAYSSVDPQMLAWDGALGMSPLFRQNPRKKRRAPKGGRGRG